MSSGSIFGRRFFCVPKVVGELLLLGFKRVRWWSALCVGAAIGAAVDEVLLSGSTNRVRGALLFAAIGAAAGLTFWIVWKLCGGEKPADSSGIP